MQTTRNGVLYILCTTDIKNRCGQRAFYNLARQGDYYSRKSSNVFPALSIAFLITVGVLP